MRQQGARRPSNLDGGVDSGPALRGRAVLGLFAATLAVMFVSQSRLVVLYDEGIILTGATRVAAGAVIHRDFYVGYGPAQLYALAALFKIFGTSILVERIWDAAIRAAIIVCVYVIATRLSSRRWPLLAAGWATVWLAFLPNPGYPLWPALLAAMIGIFATFRAMDDWTALRLAAAGVCVGLTVLFRYDIGFFLCAAESIILFLYCIAQHPASRGRLLQPVGRLLPFWGGTALVCAPVAAAYLAVGAMPDFWFDIVEYPAKNYAKMRSLPAPSPIFLGLSHLTEYIVYLPIVAALCAAAALSYSHYHADDGGGTGGESRWRWMLALLATVTMAFFLKGIVRISSVHMGSAIIPAIVVIVVVAASYKRARPGPVAAALGFAFIVGAMPTLRAASHTGQTLAANLQWAIAQGRAGTLFPNKRTGTGWCGSQPGLFRVACFDIGDDQSAAALFVQSRMAGRGRLYIGTSRHDRIFANDVALYFASGFAPITKWYHFDPGLQNSAATQVLMVREFDSDKPGYIILDSIYDDTVEPNGSAQSTGVTLIDRYIRDHYHRVAKFGTCTVEELNPPQ